MAHLLRTNQVVETSERHLVSIADTNLDKLEIANYFSQIATVVFFSEMEEKLKEIVKDRFRHGGDEKLATFLAKTNEKLLSRMKRKEISDTVGLFGDACKEDFQSRFPASDLEIYSNVIKDRHDTSHGDGGTVTLSEVKRAVEIAERILVSVKEVIT
jgi:hypothetical protein